MRLHLVDVFVPSTTRYTETWGVVFPHMWGLMWGYIWGYGRGCQGDKSPAKICSSCLAYLAGLRGGVLGQGSCVWLDQTELSCTLDGRTATIDVQFRIDALSVGANGAQPDHEFTGDLRPRKLGVEQAEHLKLTRTERLDQRLRDRKTRRPGDQRNRYPIYLLVSLSPCFCV